MTLSAATVWEVRTAGADTSGGGFVAGASGTDYSQQDAVQFSGSDLVIDVVTNTVVTSASHNFVAADVGNLIQITGGTGYTVGFYQIVSVAANAATLDRSPGAVGLTGGVWAEGGALATPGKAMGARVAGNTIWAKGSSTTTTNTANVAGGRLDFNISGTQTAFNKFYGYTTTRGDNGKYTITLGATFAGPILTMNNANPFHDVRNLAIVGNSTNGASAVATSGRSNRIQNLKVSGFTGTTAVSLVSMTLNSRLKDFEISGGSTANGAGLSVAGACLVSDGWVHGNAGRGVDISGTAAATLYRVASVDHTGANGYGFHLQSASDVSLIGCVAWNNAAGDYFLQNANLSLTCIRCVSGGGGGYNWDNRSGADAVELYLCAAKANTTGLYPVTPNKNMGLVTLTGEPFTAKATGDFSPDSTAGEGAALRDVASTLFGLTTTYADIGMAQHQPVGTAVGYVG